MKIATWNINSITVRLPLLLTWLQTHQPDALCVQETKCTDDKFPREPFTEIGYQIETYGQPTYNGVAILSRHGCAGVQRGFPDDARDAQARLITATINDVHIVNVYVPNGGTVDSDKYFFKLDWMKKLREFMDARYKTDERVLLCGDFNVAPQDLDVHDPEQWRGQVLFSEPERKALEFIKDWGFTDAFRLIKPDAREFSWWDYRAGAFRRNMGLRIDHIFASSSLAAACADSWIDRETRRWERPSDHAPVVAEFDLD